jgi:hypothetical protein
MTRKFVLALGLLASPLLGGCVAQAALVAADLSRYVPGPQRASNAHLRPAATEACTQRAAQHGSVFVLDVEQRRVDRLVVWGSVTDAQQHRRTFECHFTTRLVSFELREIGGRN